MPATYRHVHTYEQITGRGRNTWKKPEPVQKPIERKIFGYDVDYATYKKYNHNEYSFGGVFHNLLAVEVWATSRELAEEFPEAAAEARKIKDQIIAEITGKEGKNLKTPKSATDFIDELTGIYTESREAYTALQKKADTAKTNMDRAYEEMNSPGCDNRQIAEARYSLARGEYQLAENASRKEYDEMYSNHRKKVAELREKFNSFLSEFYSANPDNLDAATIKLLEYGICNASDMVRLAERHKGNPTMLRILGEHARKMRSSRNISQEDQGKLAVVSQKCLAAKDGSRELAIFDSAVNSMEYGLGREPGHANRMDSHVREWMESFENQMKNLPNSLAESAELSDEA